MRNPCLSLPESWLSSSMGSLLWIRHVTEDLLEISSTFLLFKDLRTGGTATVVTSTGSTEKEFAMPGV